LCELLAEELEPLIGGRARIQQVDISQDATLERLYGLRIPVLMSGEDELSSYPLDHDRVARYLSSL
jgi:hypothetical protein